MHAYRATLHAEGFLAVEAAVGLGDGIGLGIAGVNRTKIAGALGGRLFVCRRAGHANLGAICYFWHAQASS